MNKRASGTPEENKNRTVYFYVLSILEHYKKIRKQSCLLLVCYKRVRFLITTEQYLSLATDIIIRSIIFTEHIEQIVGRMI